MKKSNTLTLTLNALFVALVLLLGLTPLGLIPIGIIKLTILHIPVIIGTIVLGLKSGLLLGFSFGFVSFISLIYHPSVTEISYILFQRSYLCAALMCFVPRLLVPVSTYYVHRALSKNARLAKAAIPTAGIAGSLTNTVFFLGLMFFFYQITGLDMAMLTEKLGFAGLSFLGIIGGIALGGGGCEALAAALISPPVVAAIRKIKRKG